MNFSLIIPTRERVELLTNLLKSIHKTTADQNNIEALVAYDLDDEPTAHTLKRVMYPWLRCFGRQRGNSLSRDYQNWLYQKSTGKYIFILNDDVEFKTPNWDDIALTKINQYLIHKLDGIFYGRTIDEENPNHPYAHFPIVSRKSVDVLGYVMNEYYGGWTADVYLYDVYRDIDRILDVPEILIQHHSFRQDNRERDATSYSMERMTTCNDILDCSQDSKKLLRYINKNMLLL